MFCGLSVCVQKITFEDRNTVNIKSYTINDFDYDKGGRTAQEYFKWRFDRMIEVKMHEILPKPAMKAVDKLTVKKSADYCASSLTKALKTGLQRCGR